MSFHINPETGNPGQCTAGPGNCPFGRDDEHFTSPEAARTAFEARMADKPEAIKEQKIAVARTRHNSAKTSLDKADRAMNDTAIWEGSSGATVEGKKRIAAVERHKRATERVAKTNAALQKLTQAKPDFAKVITEAKDELRNFFKNNAYPSASNPTLMALKTKLAEASEGKARADYAIPATWKPRENYNGGIAFVPATLKSGPNGSLLVASTKRPSSSWSKDLPEEGLYVQTSAGYYISGPYDTPEELEASLKEYNGPSNPGPDGRD